MDIVKQVVKKVAKIVGLGVYDKKRMSDKHNKWEAINHSLLSVTTCVDIGVGRGTNSMYRNVTFDKLVLIEPLSRYKKDIERIKNKEGAIWVKKAASSVHGREKITVNKDKPEKSSFLERTSRYKRYGEKKEMVVEKATLDSIVRENRLTGNYGIKIDTEGHDLEVLIGAKETLKQTKWVVVEVPVESRFIGSYDMDEITKMMSERGFYIGGVTGMDVDAPVKFIDFIFFNKAYR